MRSRCYVCNRDVSWDLAVYDAFPSGHGWLQRQQQQRQQQQSPQSSTSRTFDATHGARRNTSSGGASFARKLLQLHQSTTTATQPCCESTATRRLRRRNTCDSVYHSYRAMSRSPQNSYRRGICVDDCIATRAIASNGRNDDDDDDNAATKLLLLLRDVPRLLAMDRKEQQQRQHNRQYDIALKLLLVLQHSSVNAATTTTVTDDPDDVSSIVDGNNSGLYYGDILVNPTVVPSDPQSANTLRYLTWSFLLLNDQTNESHCDVSAYSGGSGRLGNDFCDADMIDNDISTAVTTTTTTTTASPIDRHDTAVSSFVQCDRRERVLLFARYDDTQSMMDILNRKVLDVHTCDIANGNATADECGSRDSTQRERIIVRVYRANARQYAIVRIAPEPGQRRAATNERNSNES